MISLGIQFRYFNDLKIHNDLQNSKQFCQALSMVEDLIDNDNLCCYYSYVYPGRTIRTVCGRLWLNTIRQRDRIGA